MTTTWFDCLLDATQEAETPRQYIFWAGIASIAAVVGPNVYINRGGVYKLSPNIFCMLIGESGLGKGLPIAIAKKLVRMVGNTRVISGRNTIASIIKDLGTSKTDPITGEPQYKDARGFIVSGEFATLIQEDKQALPTLTEFYDTHYMEDWDNKTKTSGIDTLKGVNVTLFGGSTPEHFSNVVPESDVKGGFVGRILTVFADKRARINPLDDTETVLELPFNSLAQHLKKISQLRGGFRFKEDARDLWIDWYNEIRGKDYHDPTGAINRLPDNVLKVAMCISMAKMEPDLMIHKWELNEAINKCINLTIDTKKIVGGKGKSQLAEQTHLVLKILWSQPDHFIFRSALLQRHYDMFDTFDLDRILATLQNAGLVEQDRFENNMVIRMTDNGVEAMKKLIERTH